MATRDPDYQIPASFIRLDDRITDPDAYINARDLQVARENHNKLISRGIKRHLLSVCDFGLNYSQYSTNPASRESGDMLFSTRLQLSSQTKEIKVVLRAKSKYAVSGAGTPPNADWAPCWLYFAIDGPGRTHELNTTDRIQITSTSYAKYSITLPVPPEVENQCFLTCYLNGMMFGTEAIASSVPILEVYEQSLLVDNTAAAAINRWDAGYVSGTIGGIVPNKMVMVIIVGGVGPNEMVYFHEPIDGLVIPGASLLNTKKCVGVQITHMDVYEIGYSSFDYTLSSEYY